MVNVLKLCCTRKCKWDYYKIDKVLLISVEETDADA
jgi:hypothetical protein